MLTDTAGFTVAVPMDLGAPVSGINYGRAISAIADYAPGDVGFTNDPYSGYLATHTRPTFVCRSHLHGAEIVCFAGGHPQHRHGRCRAGWPVAIAHRYPPGRRALPAGETFRAGELNEGLVARHVAERAQARAEPWRPKAFIGALNTGERKVHAMLAKFGVKTFKEGLASLLDYAEHQAREILRGIPDGEYFFADYADEDAVDGNPCRLALTLRIVGDSAVLDFTGTDPQLTSALNVPTGSDPRHTLLLVGVYYRALHLNPATAAGPGLTRPLTCICRKAPCSNPVFPPPSACAS